MRPGRAIGRQTFFSDWFPSAVATGGFYNGVFGFKLQLRDRAIFIGKEQIVATLFFPMVHPFGTFEKIGITVHKRLYRVAGGI